MSELTYTADHDSEGLALLLSQFASSANLRALLSAGLEQVQALEDVHLELLTDRAIDTATGWQLDQLGKLVGQPRDGRTDAQLRLWIKARRKVNRSSGNPVDLLEVLQLVLADTSLVTITEQWPAGYEIVQDTDGAEDDDEVFDILVEATAAGVGVWYVTRVAADALTLSATDSKTTSTTLGLANDGATTGGYLMAVRSTSER